MKVYSKVFLWMFIGLIFTFLTGYYVSTNENMLYAIFSNSLYLVFAIAEIVLVIFLSARIRKMSITTARITFLLYSFLTGLTFSSIFVAFSIDSIISIFLITGVVFGIFAFLGYVTNIDLTRIGAFLFMALIGIIICTIVNLFLGNDTFDLIISIISVIVFIGYTAYDIKKIKMLSEEFDDENKLAIIGALELYLDFINLFIDLLRIFGRSND